MNIGPQDPPGATFGTQFACQLGDRDRSFDKVGLRVPVNLIWLKGIAFVSRPPFPNVPSIHRSNL